MPFYEQRSGLKPSNSEKLPVKFRVGREFHQWPLDVTVGLLLIWLPKDPAQ